MNPEPLLVALLLVLALGWPLLANARDRRRRFLIGAGLLTLGAAAHSLLEQRIPTPVPLHVDVPSFEPTGDYVGSSACRACHPGQHDSWATSFHSRMTQVAEADRVLGDFSGELTEPNGERWRLSREGDQLLVRRLDELPIQDYPVVLTTGSHHYQVYWYARRDQPLGQFPFVWFREQERWIPRNAAFLRPPLDAPDEGGRWNHTCLRCHTVNPVPGLQHDGSFKTRVEELGIACEACHGPGRLHVEANRTPTRRYAYHLSGESDPTILDPADLDAEAQSQVCGQCHSVSLEHDPERWVRWAQEGSSYRPGDDLSEARLIVMPERLDEDPVLQRVLELDPTFFRGRFWPDGEVRVTGRELNALQLSACSTRGEMSCLSCHRMHGDGRPHEEWRDDQLGIQGDASCTQCHEELADPSALQRHTRHPPESSGSRCLDCHMPYTSYGLLKAVRSHAVRSPDLALELSAGRPTACNQCHLDQTLAWTAQHLEDWYGHEPPSLSREEREVSATVLWLLRGDAGQRALAAYSAGRAEAQQISGSAWLGPQLAPLLGDPYVAVRMIAGRSLRSLPDYADLDYDFLSPAIEQAKAATAVLERWEALGSGREHPGPRGLFGPEGALDLPAQRRLLSERDDRPMFMAE